MANNEISGVAVWSDLLVAMAKKSWWGWGQHKTEDFTRAVPGRSSYNVDRIGTQGIQYVQFDVV
jgi:hypothetical protein